MAAKLIRATDPIAVANIGTVLYGEPGSRKSSLGQTADEPFTFAFDPGIYRAYGRRDCAVFDEWGDVVATCHDSDSGSGGELGRLVASAKTLVLDTLGMGMQKLARALIADNPKNGNRLGGLSLPGYGALATQFCAWVEGRLSRKQDVVMICHEDSEKRGDELYHRPAIIGNKFYDDLMRFADIVGYMHFDKGRKVIDFAPSDLWMAKTPPCGWGQITLPDFKAEPHFLARLLSEAKASMGQISEASAASAALVASWQEWIATDPNLDTFNARLPEVGKLNNGIKAQVWHILKAHADKCGLVFDAKAKTFALKQEAAA